MNSTEERPLILTAQEVNAVLADNKTQHRVLAKLRYGMPEFMGSRDCNSSDPSLWGWDNFEDGETRILSNEPCPFGAIGDRLWVQELHARTEREDRLTRIHYYADGSLRLDLRHDAGLLTKYSPDDMPRWASRLLLEITDIRIERLNDISEADAIAEGIKPIHSNPDDRVGPNHFTKSNGWYHCSRPTAAEVFKEMYKISDDFDKYGDNPWVWVVEFKVIKEASNG